MTVEHQNYDLASWGKAEKTVRRTAERYRMAVRISLGFYLLAGLFLFFTYAPKMNFSLAVLIQILLILSALGLSYEGLYRWGLLLNQPATKERIGFVLAQGPEFISEIYSHTPRAFRFMLGSPSHNLGHMASFVGHNLRWFITSSAAYRPAYGLALSFGVLLLSGLTLGFMNLTGNHAYYRSVGEWQFAIIISLVMQSVFMYFIHLLERQVIALRRVAQIIRELAAAE